MAGSLTTSVKNTLLDSLNLKTIKLHTEDPTEAGTTGEVTDASQDFTANAAADGAVQTPSDIQVSVPAGTTVTHYSIWSGDTTPICIATGALPASQYFAAAGTYVVDSLTIDLNK